MLKLRVSKFLLEAGLDEAGRGCLAGPVTAAAVILPKDFKHPLLNDSKQLSEKKRELLRPIIELSAIDWAVAHVWPEEIDEINILQASFLAMHRALDQLKTQPEFLAVDGNRFKPYQEIEHSCEVKGDGRFMNIAAASVLAKTHRDEIMLKLHDELPHYNWMNNKGYPSKEHRASIANNGSSKYHRKSFKLLPSPSL